MDQRKNNLKGLLALSPLVMFIAIFLAATLFVGDIGKVPVAVVFLATCIYATLVVGKGSIKERIETLSRGAGKTDALLMVWIFALAGAFTQTARGMGTVDAMVNTILALLPADMILPGLFAASCIVSFALGTSVGTIVALVPIATGLAQGSPELSVTALTVAAVVSGAFFGDNLSFISDTTVVATSTQGCNMNDKFKANAMITIPVAIIVILIYTFIPSPIESTPHSLQDINSLTLLPYLIVIGAALAGLHVTLVLTLGLAATGIIGLADGHFTLLTYMQHISQGMISMGELILVTLMAGGLLELIHRGGGIDFIVEKLTRRLQNKRSAELSIAGMVTIVDICTANNTIAILTVGGISKRISTAFNIDKRRSASLLDTTACCVQGLLPYGAQLMMAAGLAAISPVEIIPYLYYTYILIVAILLAIAFQFPKRFTTSS